jgi:phospholipid transport system substrate-binding protein
MEIRFMKIVFSVLAAILLMGAPIWASAEVDAPDVMLRNTVQDVLEIVRNDKDIRAGNMKRVLELIDAKVLPHFDFTRMTQLAVGRSWRTATPEQKQMLVTEFRTMLVRTYAKAFTQFHDQTVEVKPLKLQNDDKEVTVKSVINKPGGQPVLVEYEMEKLAEGWKVFDVSIEGVSLVATNRSSFTEKVQQSGIDGLIASLTTMNRNASTSNSGKAESK